jgi:hypothetical protein
VAKRTHRLLRGRRVKLQDLVEDGLLDPGTPLRLEVSGDAPGALEAVWALTDEADGRLAERARVSAA